MSRVRAIGVLVAALLSAPAVADPVIYLGGESDPVYPTALCLESVDVDNDDANGVAGIKVTTPITRRWHWTIRAEHRSCAAGSDRAAANVIGVTLEYDLGWVQ